MEIKDRKQKVKDAILEVDKQLKERVSEFPESPAKDRLLIAVDKGKNKLLTALEDATSK